MYVSVCAYVYTYSNQPEQDTFDQLVNFEESADAEEVSICTICDTCVHTHIYTYTKYGSYACLKAYIHTHTKIWIICMLQSARASCKTHSNTRKLPPDMNVLPTCVHTYAYIHTYIYIYTHMHI